jgi:asparagine synthase (glutamine-hydrolysing)
MCGIAIHFSLNGPATPLDLALIRHRGPDSSGGWTSPDGQCWLGSTRLAIIDLSPSGEQPMADPATGNVIVANGEIYNHRALRAQLGPDVSWKGTSDTETLLRGYARWGHEVLDQLKGMFAFAIYDAAREELFLARDRLGIKPLYYTLDDARRSWNERNHPAINFRLSAMGRLPGTKSSLPRSSLLACRPRNDSHASGRDQDLAILAVV